MADLADVAAQYNLTLHAFADDNQLYIHCKLIVDNIFFAVRVVKVWNSLPEEVISAPRLSVFTFRLKNVNLSRFLVGKL